MPPGTVEPPPLSGQISLLPPVPIGLVSERVPCQVTPLWLWLSSPWIFRVPERVGKGVMGTAVGEFCLHCAVQNMPSGEGGEKQTGSRGAGPERRTHGTASSYLGDPLAFSRLEPPPVLGLAHQLGVDLWFMLVDRRKNEPLLFSSVLLLSF